MPLDTALLTSTGHTRARRRRTSVEAMAHIVVSVAMRDTARAFQYFSLDAGSDGPGSRLSTAVERSGAAAELAAPAPESSVQKRTRERSLRSSAGRAPYLSLTGLPSLRCRCVRWRGAC